MQRQNAETEKQVPNEIAVEFPEKEQKEMEAGKLL